ncbi:MAG: fibronectin type III domain-containing protein [Candidatus Parcubacteria bacterium]|nr:fibronectin type III domain-containing protein [Candidatus Parcubacteria bacterium]
MNRCLKKNKFFLNILILMVLFLLGNCYIVRAASLFSLSDRVTRHAPLTPSDHAITFTTPSGLGEAGDYIRISFDGGFDLSSIIFSDISLSHGPISGLEITETVSAAPLATNWGLTISGNHLDLIHPTNSANGDIAPNDIIYIKVGGTHKIINPATIGSKVISLVIYNSSNIIIDSGRLAIPVTQDQVGVGGAPFGTLPIPVTLNFPYSVTTNSLDLDWTEYVELLIPNPQFDRYELYMGTSPGVTNLNGILLPPDPPSDAYDITKTIFSIDGLAPNRTYYFVVYVYNDLGYYAASNEVYATTQSGGIIWPSLPAAPTINSRICPIFLPNTAIDGTKPAGTAIYVNGSTQNINYPTDLLWNKLVNLGLGTNLFLIYAQDNYGQNSSMLTATVNRCEVGDTNCNLLVDDFDLAGLAGHWETNWCYADFNEDGIVDDFDLSGLAAHWDSVY